MTELVHNDTTEVHELKELITSIHQTLVHHLHKCVCVWREREREREGGKEREREREGGKEREREREGGKESI